MNMLITVLWCIASACIGVVAAVLLRRAYHANEARKERARMERARQRVLKLRQPPPEPQELRDVFRERLQTNPIVGAAERKRIERDWIGQHRS